MHQFWKIFLGFLTSIVILVTANNAAACSRVLWNNGQTVLVGRTMDWFNPMVTQLYILPEGMKRDGLMGGNTLKWTSKYGSLVTNAGGAASDGMNERGLAGHMLWLAEADYGQRDKQIPSLAISQWLQYYLDNFATVDEAVQFTQDHPFQLITSTFDGKTVTVHLALEDASGDSAVIEYHNGKPKIYHGRQYTVMTNSPPYDEQLKELSQYTGFGGDKPLPGSTEAADRFVRAAYYLQNLPKPKDYRESIAEILSVMQNVAQPYGSPDPSRPNIALTRWSSISDLTNRIYYFTSRESPNIVWIKLKEFNFKKNAPVKTLDLNKHPDLIGDVSKQFVTAKPFVPMSPEKT